MKKQYTKFNPSEEKYAKITAPVLLIHGDRDVVTPLETVTTELHSYIPNSELVVLEDVNHFPPTEAPEKVTSLIKKHLEKCF
ncbi:alpha/beta fold hydrolase [Paenibacillus kribbensis]|uniref:alpha/beta fold hydrolase n=1 Tax=Paenibacillus kribbensis TaxID=172713 RepID=UPI0009FE492D